MAQLQSETSAASILSATLGPAAIDNVSYVTNLLPSNGSEPMPVPSSELISDEVYVFTLFLFKRLVHVLQALGLVCNITNVLVLTRPSMRSSATRYLTAISVVQLVYIVQDMSVAIYSQFSLQGAAADVYMRYKAFSLFYFGACLRRTQYLLSCLVMAERLLAVLTPLKAKHYVIVTRPVQFIVATPFLVFSTHVFFALKFDVVQVSTGNTTVYVYRLSDVYLQSFDVMTALVAIVRFLFVYSELIFLIVGSIVMIVGLKRHSSKRRQMKTSANEEAVRRRELQLTVTILVSTIIFVCLCLINVTNILVYDFIPDQYGPFSPQQNLFGVVDLVAIMCYILAFSFDFFTYMSLSSAYRDTLLVMLKKMFCLHNGDKTVK